MSQQELKRVEVIALRRSGQIDQTEAARRLGVTVRQVRRLEAKVAAQGAVGLRSARRGQPSNHRLASSTVTEVSRLIRDHYRDFGPTLASEYLAERHGLALSRETVRQIMMTGPTVASATRSPSPHLRLARTAAALWRTDPDRW